MRLTTVQRRPIRACKSFVGQKRACQVRVKLSRPLQKHRCRFRPVKACLKPAVTWSRGGYMTSVDRLATSAATEGAAPPDGLHERQMDLGMPRAVSGTAHKARKAPFPQTVALRAM